MTYPPAPLYLGIDTGGTFTDGVLLDPATRSVVKTVKVLTTHHDLRLCIADVLERLIPADSSVISLVALSTTLATNAIAEGKRKSVALLLLGYDARLVQKFNFQEQFGTNQFYFIDGRHNLEGVEQVALDEAEIARIASEVRAAVEGIAVSSYAGPRNTGHETRAAEILSTLSHLPVVQAHHLSNELDSIRRATTASLNASLLSNAQDFLDAVQSMLGHHGIHCPVMMVRGDGSIVTADFARKRPVEIIHSGPATSAIGGQFLSGAESALVIDIGGTTTDIALVEQGKVQVQENAATVGHYRTCVRTIKVRSFGLGGDSLIQFEHDRSLSIGPERVVPFAYLAFCHPAVKEDLAEWLKQKKAIHYSDQIEYWRLRHEPSHPLTNPRQQKILELLREGPQRLGKLLKQVKAVSPVQVGMDTLVNDEIIERSCLTPTDLLHITGEFAPWDAQAARMIATAAAQNWGEEPEAFSRRVKKVITDRIVAEIIQFLSHRNLSDPSLGFNLNGLDRWLYEENLQPQDPHLGCSIFLKDPIVGIGAPAQAFLPAVAEALGTRIILPEHYEVANAVGTVVGNIMVRLNGEVSPAVVGSTITGYFARAGSLQEKFESFKEALVYARQALVDQIAAEARNAGASAPIIECQEEEIIPNTMMRLSAWAAAKPDLIIRD